MKNEVENRQHYLTKWIFKWHNGIFFFICYLSYKTNSIKKVKIPETWYVNFIIFVPFKRRLNGENSDTKIVSNEQKLRLLSEELFTLYICRIFFVGKLQLDFKNLPKIKQLSDFNEMFSTYAFMNEFVYEKGIL